MMNLRTMFGRNPVDLFFRLTAFASVFVRCRTSCSFHDSDFNDLASRTAVAKVVFEGRAMHLVEMDAESQQQQPSSTVTAVKFKVDKVYKGAFPRHSGAEQELSVVVGAKVPIGEYDCLLSLKPNQEYFVFLRLESAEVVNGVSVYWISGPTAEYTNKSARDVKKHSCRNCAQTPSVKLMPQKKILIKSSGANVTIKCTVKGRPVPVITWLKNDQPLKNSERLVINNETKTKSVLLIRNVGTEDLANYSCQATNALGVSNSSPVTLRIKQENKSDSKFKECEKHRQALCLNGGTCHLLADNRTPFCVCRRKYTGRRCQDRGPEIGSNRIPVQSTGADKALASVVLLMLLLLLIAVVTLLFCVARFRHDYKALHQQMSSDEIKAEIPLLSAKPFASNRVEKKPLQPNVQCNTKADDDDNDDDDDERKLYRTVCRDRLCATSSVPEAGQLYSREENEHHKKRNLYKRMSSSSGSQAPFVNDDEVDGLQLRKITDDHRVDLLLNLCSANTHRLNPRSQPNSMTEASAFESRLCTSSQPINYNDQRLQTSQDSADSERQQNKNVNVLSLTLPSSNKDFTNEETDEVNNLLKELGVYTSDDSYYDV